MRMKNIVLVIALAFVSMAGYSQSIMGKWVTEAGDAQVEIYQQGDKVNGKTYKCTIWLEGNNLKVRGYLGIFYETQTWKRK